MVDFEMYSAAGNGAVTTMVGDIATEMRSAAVTRPNLPTRIVAGCKAVTKAGFEEVWDTEPQWGIADALSKVCIELGWQPISRWDW